MPIEELKIMRKSRKQTFIIWSLVMIITVLGIYIFDRYGPKLVSKIEARNPNTYYTIGLKHLANGEYNLAAENFRRAIELNPKVAVYHLELGKTYAQLNQFKEAIEKYQQAIKLDPHQYQSHYYLGLVYRRLNRQKEALEALRTAVSLDTVGDPWPFNELGWASYEAGLYDEAIQAWRKVIELNPNALEWYLYLAMAYKAKNDIDNAINFYRKVISLIPNCKEAHSELVNLYRKKGDFQKAKEIEERLKRIP